MNFQSLKCIFSADSITGTILLSLVFSFSNDCSSIFLRTIAHLLCILFVWLPVNRKFLNSCLVSIKHTYSQDYFLYNFLLLKILGYNLGTNKIWILYLMSGLIKLIIMVWLLISWKKIYPHFFGLKTKGFLENIALSANLGLLSSCLIFLFYMK